jgi:putative oxidoreductase
MADAAVDYRSQDDAGKLVLRVVLGVLILLHGIAKITGGNAFTEGMEAKTGLPAVFAYGVYIGEVIAPLLLIAGLWTRAAALVIVINMLVAVGLVHMGQLFSRAANGGYALELQAMYLFGAVAVMLLGAGRYSVGGDEGRWN